MVRLSRRVLGGSIFLIIGLYILIKIEDYTSLSYLMPLLYGCLMVVLAAVLILQGIWLKKDDQSDRILLNFSKIGQGDGHKIFEYALVILIYYIGIHYLGMVVSTVVFLSFSYWYLGIRSIKSHLILQGMFALCYCVFTTLLKVNFPHGILY